VPAGQMTGATEVEAQEWPSGHVVQPLFPVSSVYVPVML
jgi:hypothetical protein